MNLPQELHNYIHCLFEAHKQITQENLNNYLLRQKEGEVSRSHPAYTEHVALLKMQQSWQKHVKAFLESCPGSGWEEVDAPPDN